MSSNILQIAALTDPGVVRENNEDSIATAGNNGLVVLADGMGGHLAGEVASGLAVDLIVRHIENYLDNGSPRKAGADGSAEAHAVSDAITLANKAVLEASQTRPECAGMGSTVVVALFKGKNIIIGHLGDSRAYRLRGGELEQLTEDHSVVQELVGRGLISKEEAHHSYHKNLVTKALGVDADVVPDVQEQSIQDNDLYLLCSDGLSDVFPDEEIQAMLLADSNDGLDKTASKLVNEVNKNGGPDNVSVILVRTGAEFTRGG